MLWQFGVQEINVRCLCHWLQNAPTTAPKHSWWMWAIPSWRDEILLARTTGR